MPVVARIVAVLLGLAVLLVFVGAGFNRLGWGPGWRDSTPEADPGSASVPTAGASAEIGGDSQAAKTSPLAGQEQRHLLLAPEQAEQQRLASLEQKQHAINPALASPPPTKLYYRVKVRDADTLEAGPTVITLEGIRARPPDASCTDANGKDWPCGAEAKFALSKFIRYRAVSCTLPEGGEQTAFASRCRVGNTDLSTWMVREGWALPEPGAEPPLADAADAAKHDHLGIWRMAE